MDPRNGEVLAIGSYPSFNPNKFAKPLTHGRIRRRSIGSGSAAAPLTDRAVNGAYPTGSTFKPITAMAALEAGVITPSEGLGAGQCIAVGDRAVLQRRPRRLRRRRPGRSAEGLLGHLLLRSRRARQQPRQRDPEHGATSSGIGSATGIDLPSEFNGVDPRRGVAREARTREELRCEHAHATSPRAASSAKCARGASATTCTWRSARATC